EPGEGEFGEGVAFASEGCGGVGGENHGTGRKGGAVWESSQPQRYEAEQQVEGEGPEGGERFDPLSRERASSVTDGDDGRGDQQRAETGGHGEEEADPGRGDRGAGQGQGEHRHPYRRAAGLPPEPAVGFHAFFLVRGLAEFAAGFDHDAIEETGGEKPSQTSGPA